MNQHPHQTRPRRAPSCLAWAALLLPVVAITLAGAAQLVAGRASAQTRPANLAPGPARNDQPGFAWNRQADWQSGDRNEDSRGRAVWGYGYLEGRGRLGATRPWYAAAPSAMSWSPSAQGWVASGDGPAAVLADRLIDASGGGDRHPLVAWRNPRSATSTITLGGALELRWSDEADGMVDVLVGRRAGGEIEPLLPASRQYARPASGRLPIPLNLSVTLRPGEEIVLSVLNLSPRGAVALVDSDMTLTLRNGVRLSFERDWVREDVGRVVLTAERDFADGAQLVSYTWKRGPAWTPEALTRRANGAWEPGDFTGVRPLTFPAGATRTQALLTIEDDAVIEPVELLVVTAEAGEGYVTTAESQAVLRILDADRDYPGFTWSRSTDWPPGQAPDDDVFGRPTWRFAYVDTGADGGHGLRDARPWYTLPRRDLAWDPLWSRSAAGRWARADDQAPTIGPRIFEHSVNTAWGPYKPVLRWCNPTGRAMYVDVVGVLTANWSAARAGGAMDVAVVHYRPGTSGPERHTLLSGHSPTAFPATLAVEARSVLVQPEDEILISANGDALSGPGVATLSDDDLSIVLVGDVPPIVVETPEDRPTVIRVSQAGPLRAGQVLERPPYGTAAFDLRTQGFLYTPEPDWHGRVSFTYAVTTTAGAERVGRVDVTVEPVNDPPAAADRAVLCLAGRSVNVDLLFRVAPGTGRGSQPDHRVDLDPDLELLSVRIERQPAHGTARAYSDGSVTYTPAAGYSGSDAFTYRILDAVGSSEPATVLVAVRQARAVHVAPEGSDRSGDGSARRPYATPAAAQAAVRRLIASGLRTPVEVVLGGGTYRLNEPWAFEASDSGTDDCPVVWRSADGEVATIVGSIPLADLAWQEEDDGVYSATVGAEVPDFRSLFVDGARATRSREPDEGYYEIVAVDTGDNREFTGFQYRAGDIDPAWQNLADVEVVSYRRWEQSRLQIRSVDGAARRVEFQGELKHPDPGKPWNGSPRGYDWEYPLAPKRYYVENAREALDSPGEWYYDRHARRLYYRPLEGTDIRRSIFEIPVCELLLVLTHTRHVSFDRMVFAQSDWSLPETGYAGHQAAEGIPLEAAILFDRTAHCHFRGNLVRQTGAYGMRLYGSNSEIVGNAFVDCGAGGLHAGTDGRDRRRGLDGPAGTHLDTHAQHNRIAFNRIHHTNAVWKEGVGLFVTFLGNSRLSHNRIWNTAYTGLSIGWRWDAATDTTCVRNLVDQNQVHDVMLELYDGGGIYTLGRQPGTAILGNYVHDVYYRDAHAGRHHGPSFCSLEGLYLDQGSSLLTLKGNLVANVEGGQNTSATEARIESNLYVDVRHTALLLHGWALHNTIRTNVFDWTIPPPVPGVVLLYDNSPMDAYLRDANVFHTGDGAIQAEQERWTWLWQRVRGHQTASTDANPGVVRSTGPYPYVLQRPVRIGGLPFTAPWLTGAAVAAP